ncbi:MAG: sugar phosphate isomerase/epimerase [Verrucomicrobia bacterium]|nr:sugar phosphate isomerase/epimerase [Verrucomicrobiota bacterium]
MLREIADLGFSHVELSHGIRITLVPGILKAIDEGVIKVGSAHNFCPLPTGITQAAPNLFEPSAEDGREHDQWLRHTKRSIDFAAQMNARVLVLHLGRVEFFIGNPADKLDAYAEKHHGVDLTADPKYKRLLEAALKRLRNCMPPYWERVKVSIEEVRAYAAERGVALGFENREKFDELPLDDDFEKLIYGVTQPNTVGYWHDTGHAEIKQRMGLLKQREHLEKHAGRLIGFHLHDVDAEGRDHRPVGTGTVDFEMISSFWKPHHLLVLEFSPRLSVEDVKQSKQRIEALMK